MFLNRVIHFGETLGDQVKGRSPKKLKSLIEVPNLVHVKVHIHLRGNLVDQVKARSPRRLKSLIKVPNVAHLRVQAVSLNLNLFFSP